MSLSPRTVRAALVAALLATTAACGSVERGTAVPAPTTTTISSTISSETVTSARPTAPSSAARSSIPGPTTPRTSTASVEPSRSGTAPGPKASPSPSSAPTSAPPGSSGGRPGDSGTLTVRLAGFDPATGQLTYVKQHLVHSSGSQPYLDDDPADPAEHRAVLAPDAEIRFVYSSCQNGYGNPQSGGVVCTRADLAKAVGSNFVAEIDVVNGSVTAVRQIYQA